MFQTETQIFIPCPPNQPSSMLQWKTTPSFHLLRPNTVQSAIIFTHPTPSSLSLHPIHSQDLLALPPIYILDMIPSHHLTSTHWSTLTSCLDCCKSIPICCPASAFFSAPLDAALNPTTRVVVLKSKLHHVTSLPRSLPKLPILSK